MYAANLPRPRISRPPRIPEAQCEIRETRKPNVRVRCMCCNYEATHVYLETSTGIEVPACGFSCAFRWFGW